MHPTKDDRPSIHFLVQSLHHDYYIRIEYIAHELEILHILVVVTWTRVCIQNPCLVDRKYLVARIN